MCRNEPFRRLLEVLLPRRGIAVLLQAYFDESEREAGTFCVAGYAFASDQARKFSKEWGRLFPHGFHMVDLAAGRGAFKNMPRSTLDRLLREAVRAVNRRMSLGVAVSCKINELESAAPHWIRGFRRAYPICCHLCMTSLGKWLRDSRFAQNVAYFFESGHPYEGEARDFIRRAVCSKELRDAYRYYSDSFLPKADAPPLQAADLLAWEWAKFYDETIQQQLRPVRQSLRALFAANVDRYKMHHITGEPLKKFMRKITELGLLQLQEDGMPRGLHAH